MEHYLSAILSGYMTVFAVFFALEIIIDFFPRRSGKTELVILPSLLMILSGILAAGLVIATGGHMIKVFLLTASGATVIYILVRRFL